MNKLITCVGKQRQTSAQNKGINEGNSKANSINKPSSSQLKIKKDKRDNTENTKNLAQGLSASRKLTFVCISDTHCKLDRPDACCIPYGDVLLHAGDFTMEGSVRELKNFNDFLGTLPHTYKVVIAGNHEQCLVTGQLQHSQSILEYYKSKYGVQRIRDLLTNCIYLEDELTEICGIKIYGSPWIPLYSLCDAFSLCSADLLQKRWDKIPDGIDILLTHGPPRGFGDTAADGVEAGCGNLLHTVQTRVKPKYHVFGHIHEGYGLYRDGTTTYINASVCTRGYKPTNQPIKFLMDIPKVNCDTSKTGGEIEFKTSCDYSDCDMQSSDLDKINIPPNAFHTTVSTLQTMSPGYNFDWSFNDSAVSLLNYTKRTET